VRFDRDLELAVIDRGILSALIFPCRRRRRRCRRWRAGVREGRAGAAVGLAPAWADEAGGVGNCHQEA
jgi:hypothetical protein